VCMPLIVITYEFHMSLNSCNTKPANIGVQWGSIDHWIALCVNFKKMYLVLKEPCKAREKVIFHHFTKKFRGSYITKYIASMSI